jgi:hypothetical protein
MTAPASAEARPAPAPLVDVLFGSLWPESALPGRPRVVVGAAVAGLLAGAVVPFRAWGLGTFLVLLAVLAPAAVLTGRPRPSYRLACAALVLPLLAQVMLRDAEWVAALSLLAAVAVVASALAEPRTTAGLVGSWVAAPLAAFRGLPWIGRSIRTSGPAGAVWPVLRTAGVSLGLVVVFGALFASADAVFAGWLDAVVPDVHVDTLPARGVVAVLVAATALAAAYVALNPPATDQLSAGPAQPVAHPFEWLVPVGVVLALYVGFLAAQAAALFGGHGYLRGTSGLTYADHVHRGFGQMSVATVLTLAVVAVAARKARRRSTRERVLLRTVLGLLCAMNLLVVASALFRMHVYADAYGATRMRLLVGVFEGWVGLVVLLVLVAGIRLDGSWLPRAALLSGAAAVLTLAVLNPDGYVAGRNLDRYAETGRMDWAYLATLSDDAVPALERLPAAVRVCALTETVRHEDWLEWNLGRHRAGALTVAADAGYGSCRSD